MARNGELLSILGMVVMLVFAHLGIMRLTVETSSQFLLLIPPLISTSISALAIVFALVFDQGVELCISSASAALVMATVNDAVLIALFFQVSMTMGWLLMFVDLSFAFPIFFLYFLLRRLREDEEEGEEREEKEEKEEEKEEKG
jgi:predicted membrane protein